MQPKLILCLFLLSIAVAAEEVEYYVVPNESNCLHYTGTPCNTLQHYASNGSFHNNAVYCFLEGDHVLNSVLNITGMTKLSFIGAGSNFGSSVIQCVSTSAGFVIQHFANLTLRGLTILHCGGAKFGMYHGALLLSGGSFLNIDSLNISNSSGYGLAMLSLQGNSTITNSIFSYNRASSWYHGGNALVTYSNCTEMKHHLNITNSGYLTGSGGLAVYINCSNVSVTISNSTFEGNQVSDIGANLLFHFRACKNNFVSLRNIISSKGRSTYGSGISVHLLKAVEAFSCTKRRSQYDKPHSLMEFNNVSFIMNSGESVVNIEEHSMCDAAVLLKDSKITDTYSCEYQLSAAVKLSSSGCYTYRMMDVTFKNVLLSNTTSCGLIIGLRANSIRLNSIYSVTFINSTFENNKMSAIHAINSNIFFQGSNIFRNNSGMYGAGLTLIQKSFIFLKRNTHILFTDNFASSVGGAMYIGESSGSIEADIIHSNRKKTYHPPCFFVADMKAEHTGSVKVDFVNNKASYAGSSLYSRSNYKNCHALPGYPNVPFNKIFNISSAEHDTSAMASIPNYICLCFGSQPEPNCSIINHIISAYPGEVFSVQLAPAGGNMLGTMPETIYAFFDSPYVNTTLGASQDSQTLNGANCSSLNYSILSDQKVVKFYMAIDFNVYLLPEVFPGITVHLKNCPLGFTLKEGKCVCNSAIITRSDIQCGYCSTEAVSFNNSNVDAQCAPHRTGLLCGKCKNGYSLMLGDQKCSICSDIYLLLLLPLALSGLMLVAVLFALNLTVTEGTVNGLIFFANVVEMASPPGNTSYLHIFIAWLNLDLGIHSCFYNGLDAYAATWLQFVFPLYLWAIIIAIIFISRNFSKLAWKLCGENAVQVLSTLLLLSYTKLQRIMVTIFSSTSLMYPNGEVSSVWLHDANTVFFRGKHLCLGVFGILTSISLIVSYTFTLAFFQQLQACSTHRLFFWVNRMKPVFDSYAGPYKDRYRMWTGFLLLVRSLLIIIFSLQVSSSPDVRFLVVLIMSLALLATTSTTGGIYKKWSCNLLESFFYLLLGVFSGGILYARYNGGHSSSVADFSMGMALLAFLVIVACHTCSRMTFLKKFCSCWRDQRDTDELEPLLHNEREVVLDQ